jgi:hypothetical protein
MRFSPHTSYGQSEAARATKRRLLAALLVPATAFLVSGTALADPNGPNVRGVATYTCDNGDTVDMGSGPRFNQGRVAWVADGTAVFVVKYAAVTDGIDTFVFFDSTQDQTDLTTCTTPGRPGDTFVTKGYFTPKS